MRSIPIDAARCGRFQLVAVLPKMQGQTQMQATNADGVAKWTVQVLLTPPAGDGFQPKAALEEVTIVAAQAPTIPPLTPVAFRDLSARPWTMGDRSGITLSAGDVRPVRGDAA